VTAVDLAGLLASAPDANRRAAAIASGLPPETPAPAIGAALLDPGRIAAIVRALSPAARRLAARAAFLGDPVVVESWTRRPDEQACELERHGLAFAFRESYWLRYFVPPELHPLLADALAAPYARNLSPAEPERWVEPPLQLAHDVAALWAYLARAPVRVKTNGTVYKRDVPKLLTALPALELHGPSDVMAVPRLEFSLALLADEGLIRVRVDDRPHCEERRELIATGDPTTLLGAEPERLRASLLGHAPGTFMAAPALALANGLEPGATVALASFGAALRTLCEQTVDGVPDDLSDFGLALGGLHFPWLAGAVSLGLERGGLPIAVRAASASISGPGRIVCQANFELIVLSPPTPAQRLVLALMCEPVADQEHVFKLTRRSVEAGQRSGLLEGGVVAALERLAGDLPQNVARSLSDWTSSLRRPLRLRTAMMIDTGDPATADDLVAGELSEFVVERLGPSHLAIRAEDIRAVEAALRRAKHELDAGIDRVSGPLGEREPRRAEVDAAWEPEFADGLPPGELISTLGHGTASPPPQLALAPEPVPALAGVNGTGRLSDGPDRHDDALAVVIDATTRGNDLLIVYAGAGGTTCRQITPYEVNGATVHAYCHQRGEDQSFWLASIQEAVELE
jgi:Helicase conserved C-terminal domain